MNDAPDAHPADSAATRASWNSALIWSILGLIGWAAFEQTAQPALGAAVFCSRLGWDDLLTALWLRRVDPHEARGRACFWFCLSLGVLRIVVAAGAMAMLVVAVQCALQKADPNPNAGDDLPSRFYGVAVLMVVGAPLLTLFALLGYAAARKGGILVWIDGLLAHARRDNAWPPEYSMDPVSPSQNRVRLVWVSALLTIGLLGLVLPIVVAIFAGMPAGAILLAVESPLILFLSRRVIARHPADCWSVSEEDASGFRRNPPTLPSGIRPGKMGRFGSPERE